jgi:hypothetical protein
VEKVYRAYIPRESVEWFNSFLTQRPEIDIWLSIRINKNTNYNVITSFNQSSFSDYKYYAEFKITDSKIIETNRQKLEKYRIKLETLIDDVRKHLEKQPISREKRGINDLVKQSDVVGKYAPVNSVTLIS